MSSTNKTLCEYDLNSRTSQKDGATLSVVYFLLLCGKDSGLRYTSCCPTCMSGSTGIWFCDVDHDCQRLLSSPLSKSRRSTYLVLHAEFALALRCPAQLAGVRKHIGQRHLRHGRELVWANLAINDSPTTCTWPTDHCARGMYTEHDYVEKVGREENALWNSTVQLLRRS